MAKSKTEVELLLSLKDEMSKGFEKISAKTKKSKTEAKGASKAFGQMGKAIPIAQFVGFAGATALVGKGLSFAVSEASKFNQAMANVASVSNPTTEEFKALSDEARRLGGATSKTAIEVSEAQLELSKLGFTADEITKSLEGVVHLTEATGEGVAESAETVASALAQFNLDASQSGEIVDTMTKSFSDSALNLERFREAMKFAGPSAKASGTDIKETTGALEVLANNAIHGTMAGNALKRMFIDMSSESSKAGKVLKKLGVETTATFTEKLEALSNAGLTFAETAEIFGKISATSATVLMKNVDAVGEYTKSLDDATGSTERMAKVRMDTLTGDMKLLGSASSELGIIIGSALTPALRGMAGTTSYTVSWFNDLIKGTESLSLKSNKMELSIIDSDIAIGDLSSGLINFGTQANLADKRAELLTEQYQLLGEEAEDAGRKISTKLTDVIAQGGGQTMQSKSGLVPTDDEKKTIVDEWASIDKEVGEYKVAQHQKHKDEALKIADELLKEELRLEVKGVEDRQDYLDSMEKGKLDRNQRIADDTIEKANQTHKHEQKIAQEKLDMAIKQKEWDDMVRDTSLDTTQSLIASAKMGLNAQIENAKRLQRINTMMILMDGAVASGKVWAGDAPWPVKIGQQIQVAAQTTAQVATVQAQKFALGGVVDGNSTTGDKVPAMVNSKEMIMNQGQQSKLWDFINGGSKGGQGVTINLNDSVIGENSFIQKVVNAVQMADQTAQPAW